MLRAVSVMQVPVHDQDFPEAVFLLRIRSRDRDVVEQAEAHGVAGFGMMPGRADEGEDRVRSRGARVWSEKRVNGLEQPSCRQSCDFIGPGGRSGIGIELGMASTLRSRNRLYMEGVVNEGEFVDCCKAGLDERKAAELADRK